MDCGRSGTDLLAANCGEATTALAKFGLTGSPAAALAEDPRVCFHSSVARAAACCKVAYQSLRSCCKERQGRDEAKQRDRESKRREKTKKREEKFEASKREREKRENTQKEVDRDKITGQHRDTGPYHASGAQLKRLAVEGCQSQHGVLIWCHGHSDGGRNRGAGFLQPVMRK